MMVVSERIGNAPVPPSPSRKMCETEITFLGQRSYSVLVYYDAASERIGNAPNHLEQIGVQPNWSIPPLPSPRYALLSFYFSSTICY